MNTQHFLRRLFSILRLGVLVALLVWRGWPTATIPTAPALNNRVSPPMVASNPTPPAAALRPLRGGGRAAQDQLAIIDPAAAADYARIILASADSPAVWAVDMHNLAQGDSSADGRALLPQQFAELLANPACGESGHLENPNQPPRSRLIRRIVSREGATGSAFG